MASEVDQKETYPVRSLAIAGYRSFGADPQFFENFSKINVFIGKNNCGKSNILRFIHDILSTSGSKPRLVLEDAEKHLFAPKTELLFGLLPPFYKDNTVNFELFMRHYNNSLDAVDIRSISSILDSKKRHDLRSKNPWFFFNLESKFSSAGWHAAFSELNDDQVLDLWNKISGSHGGSRERNWIPDILNKLAPWPKDFPCMIVPAIRKITASGNGTHQYDGGGMVERLALLQAPAVFEQAKKQKFKQIVRFFQNVTDCENATIEIPYNRDTIHVEMDGKVLALDSLGSGIHEVIILATAATLVDNSVICLEEPELHLNPILQKKLIRYLQTETTNQYFITTHSPALMDTPGAEVYHIQLKDGSSLVERVSSDSHRSDVCEDLGYHPSDLLQANCVIWVEGPSDRIYLNWWIKHQAKDLVEGIHYSVMFYGGRLAAHLSGDDIGALVDDFISLRRLNRRGVILIDSDKADEKSELNDTKKRLQTEFNVGPGFAWVTDGREVENYIDPELLKTAIAKVHPRKNSLGKFMQWDNVLKLENDAKENDQANKVKIAHEITSGNTPDYDRLELQTRIDQLLVFIRESNPSTIIRQ